MRLNNLFIFIASLGLFFISAASYATQINGSYELEWNDRDPGLVVQTEPVAPSPFSFNLDVNESKQGGLFKIWTTEKYINGDDRAQDSIKLLFSLQGLPGEVTGTTQGETDWVFLFFHLDEGTLTWDDNGPIDFFFGPHMDGHLQIWLDDAVFNKGDICVFDCATNPGKDYSAIVQARIKLIADATAVPEPSILALFGFGLIGLGFAARRRRG